MRASPRIALVDFGAGNLRSVAKALERSGLEPEISSDAACVRRADAVVLPGVGAFADAVTSLGAGGLDDALREHLAARRPYLGLCLGLQVLFEESDEHGVTRGLGVLPGRVERFPDRAPDGARLRVPHIGWNSVKFSGDHPMLAKLPAEDFYYFVHSYRAVPKRASDVVGRVDYGGTFAAAVAREGLFAVQFHPEKSQGAGRRLLDAFADWLAQC
ncbi:MAG TPA: imidazole glycerol phosphate synthase subunit HisH [Myxococcota bacterium]|nr:imidazole glycerol phosphate synthase subunit HisH [Myxococcota bacterium]